MKVCYIQEKVLLIVHKIILYLSLIYTCNQVLLLKTFQKVSKHSEKTKISNELNIHR